MFNIIILQAVDLETNDYVQFKLRFNLNGIIIIVCFSKLVPPYQLNYWKIQVVYIELKWLENVKPEKGYISRKTR